MKITFSVVQDKEDLELDGYTNVTLIYDNVPYDVTHVELTKYYIQFLNLNGFNYIKSVKDLK